MLNQNPQLIIIINTDYPSTPLYEDHILEAAKRILKRNCTHLRKGGDCRCCAEFSPKDRACKIGVPCAWK